MHRILIRAGLRTVRGDLFILLARCGGVSQSGKFYFFTIKVDIFNVELVVGEIVEAGSHTGQTER